MMDDIAFDDLGDMNQEIVMRRMADSTWQFLEYLQYVFGIEGPPEQVEVVFSNGLTVSLDDFDLSKRGNGVEVEVTF